MKSEQQAVRVWINGSVYSPADPFATAILLDGATVATAPAGVEGDVQTQLAKARDALRSMTQE